MGGSAFTLYFPVTRKRVRIEAVSPSLQDLRGEGQSILVVDDVLEQREIAHSILAELGYKADTVPSGEDALAFLKANRVDLMILDMIMDPGIDGLETYRRTVELNPGQKALIASGYSETHRVREAQSLGAGQYIRKPYTIEKIALAVKKELER